MKTDEIKIMLTAFYNGDTTPDEEQILLKYFSREEIAGDLPDEKELFLRMYQAEPINVPPALESKLKNLIDELALNEEQTAIKPRRNKRHLLKRAGSVAACIAVLISVTVYFNNKPEINQSPPVQEQAVGNLSDADKKALREAQDALILLSSNFNKGVGQLTVVSSNIDKTNEILNKTLKNCLNFSQ
ncbi:MAG: hypothetical protein LBR26_08005 [Prevotella sp.]|jgi:hypothetical protein|nr:hypothetical protein [Prevotella sp.]